MWLDKWIHLGTTIAGYISLAAAVYCYVALKDVHHATYWLIFTVLFWQRR